MPLREIVPLPVVLPSYTLFFAFTVGVSVFAVIAALDVGVKVDKT